MRKVILFDFDGVICDSFEHAYATACRTLEGEITREEYKRLFEGNIYDSAKSYAYKPGMGDEHYYDLYHQGILEQRLFEISDVLRALSATYPLHIVSSTTNRVLESYLAHHELRSCFAEIHGAEVHRKKTVKIENILAQGRWSPQEAVMVTDTVGDIREARSLGVASIAVSWGFHDAERLLKENPYRVVMEPKEIPEAIQTYFSD